MARKNILAGLMDNAQSAPQAERHSHQNEGSRTDAPVRSPKGALGAVTRTIDALTAKAAAAHEIERKLTEGETIVELDAARVEESFITDRLRDDEAALNELVEAIRLRGQDSPILVRPHPEKAGHYQVAFGHRRLRAARLLGIPVRAVVKQLADRDHVIAQGQENSARTDLSFIERATFARGMEEAGFEREVIMSALTSDKTTISKMLSIFERIPPDILGEINCAFSVGRDRWHDLSARFEEPAFHQAVRALMASEPFESADADTRFSQIESLILDPCGEPRRGSKSAPEVRNWLPEDGQVKIKIREDSKGFSIALKAPAAASFGLFIEQNLERLYQEFQEQQNNTEHGE
ncbi:plasmid partitioning protein RepB [Xaviernesmea oryzae]|uniref:Plasmid partitioning protein RepB n=1 Tax=Xaviernesmea oryzae TaxID=464029 RepID=A0A1Q9B3S7_9HYPH|nr:plasmid partitioning protein RepB [Xaviernesmea oryzae]OLP62704.1 plasmid partitioning protein RepB [Xaviernesmea oryzae]SEM27065.1 chromosome partitioning protein, ParB family [Xaviernesmea oryzae]